jgi:hypothetical protein
MIDIDNIEETAEMAYLPRILVYQNSKVIYITVPIEYPATSPNGVATIFNVQGWKNYMDAFNDVSKQIFIAIYTLFLIYY